MTDGDNSDALGAIAEDLVKVMARRAKLIASSLAPDRTGKDLILEEQLATPNGTSFDTRSGPRICVLQVKATQAAKPKVGVKLSVAERLAKEPNAAAIVVLRLNADLECAEAYLIHVHGKRLDAVLKRLRRETKRGTIDLHKQEMSFTVTQAERFKWSPDGLHEAFVRLFPASVEQYVASKAGLLATTGYAAERYLVNFKVDGDLDELAEGFVGLKKLPVSSFEVLERRFAIDLPSPPEQFGATARVEFTPQPSEVGTLVLTDADSGDQLEIACEVVVPPAQLMPHGEVRVLFRWSMGGVFMGPNEWKFSPSEKSVAETENTVADWLLHARTMDMLERRRVDIKYVGEKGTLSFTSHGNKEAVASAKYTPVIHTLTEIDRLLVEAGKSNDPTSLTALWEQRRLVEAIGNFRNKHVKFMFRTGPMSFPELANERGLHLGAAQIGRTWVAIAMPMLVSTKIVGKEVEWTGYRSGPTVLEALSDGEEATFTKFRVRAQKLSSTPLVFFQEPGSYLGDITAVVADQIEERHRSPIEND